MLFPTILDADFGHVSFKILTTARAIMLPSHYITLSEKFRYRAAPLSITVSEQMCGFSRTFWLICSDQNQLLRPWISASSTAWLAMWFRII